MDKDNAIFLVDKKTYIKVTCVVNIKLALIDWFCYNLITLIKQYKIWYLNLDKTSSFLRNYVICLKNWKLWWDPSNIKFNILGWNFEHVSYLTMSKKGKNVKNLVSVSD